MHAAGTQIDLFGALRDVPVTGLKYQTQFLADAEEEALLEVMRALPLEEAQYRQWRAHRRIGTYGSKYDFSTNEFLPAASIPPFLLPLRERVARWSGIPASRFCVAVIAEYRRGTQLGWHRDIRHFEAVVGVSLAGPARMRFRPYPPDAGHRRAEFSLDLEPRSIYALQGAARWNWQHAISATKSLRYSITFRTLASHAHGSAPSLASR